MRFCDISKLFEAMSFRCFLPDLAACEVSCLIKSEGVLGRGAGVVYVGDQSARQAMMPSSSVLVFILPTELDDVV